MPYTKDDLFLGFDLSTQQLKVIVTNASLKALETYHVEFDDAFATKYRIRKGVRSNELTGEIVSPVHMWLEAIDHVFSQMKAHGFPFSQVRGLCGSGMQHGSIFWSENATGAFANIESALSLCEGLKDAFANNVSPNWQDHSTGKEIGDFEKVAGGPDALAQRTGSRAHYRFTGLQIRKLATRSGADVYKNTDRISLVSSFLASVLLGKIAPLEEADACGMNIYNVADSSYDDELLAVAAGVHPELDAASAELRLAGVKELKRKLGDILPVTYEALGCISSYFVKTYGFASDAKIYSFTGDNLATIISLPLKQNDVLVSLGTSTTVLLVTENYNPSSQYHLFKHPTIKSAYMGMICYCNGSLARENVRDAVNEKHNVPANSWEKFDELLDGSVDFDNRLGIYFPLGEIVPNASAQFQRYELKGGKVVNVGKWDVDYDVSSIVESQSISCRMRAGPMLTNSSSSADTPEAEDSELKSLYHGLHEQFGDIYTDGKKQTFHSLTSRPRTIYYVGGASKNKSIIRKIGSIMGATEGNFQVEIPNACALGGAYKASWSFASEQQGQMLDFNKYLSDNFDFGEVESFEVQDRWANYFPAMGLLSKMESNLKHD